VSKTGPWADYLDMFADLSDYFRRYGGIKAFALSPYTLAALLITVVCWGSWRVGSWPDTPLTILPALLGFTLAAYALLLAFGDEKFRAFLAEQQSDFVGTNVPGDNALLGISAIFLHFVVVQVVALVLAVIANSHPLATFGGLQATEHSLLHVLRNLYAFVGFFSFVLSLALALAAGLAIFHSARWYVLFKGVEASVRGQSDPN